MSNTWVVYSAQKYAYADLISTIIGVSSRLFHISFKIVLDVEDIFLLEPNWWRQTIDGCIEVVFSLLKSLYKSSHYFSLSSLIYSMCCRFYSSRILQWHIEKLKLKSSSRMKLISIVLFLKRLQLMRRVVTCVCGRHRLIKNLETPWYYIWGGGRSKTMSWCSLCEMSIKEHFSSSFS